MAITNFFLYPTSTYETAGTGGVGGWNGGFTTQNFQHVDEAEPITAHDGLTTWDYGQGWESSARWFHITYGFGSPPMGLTINKIRIYAAFFLSSQSDPSFSATPEIITFVRPAGSAIFYSAAAASLVACAAGGNVARVKDFAHYKRNTSQWSGGTGPGYAYWEFSTNPATGIAWTLADLSNLKAGFACITSAVTWSGYAGLDIPALIDYGGFNYGDICCTQFFIWVEAQTIAASIESERAKGSHFLRLFRRPIRKFSLVVPPQYANIDVGDTFVVDHQQGPHSTPGWGKKDWERRESILLSSSINPTTREVELTAIDARDFRVGLWSPLITDFGFSEDGNGIPILHQGSTLTFPNSVDDRSSTHYVKKQVNDATYAATGAGKGLWTPNGMCPGTSKVTNRMTYSCFNGGSGTTFTGWSATSGGGGTLAEDLSNFLIDVTGFRRGPKLSCPTSGTSYIYQTSGTFGAAGLKGRIRVHLTRLSGYSAGDGKAYYILQRISDGWWWRDSTKTWVNSLIANQMDTGLTVGIIRYVSEQIDLSVSTTYTLNVGLPITNTGASITVNEASLLTADSSEAACGIAAENEPLYPSGASATVMQPDYAYFEMRGDQTDIREDRGTMVLTVIPRFNHSDMSDGDVKLIWLYRRHLGAEGMIAYYARVSSTQAKIAFQRRSAAITSDGYDSYETSINVNNTEVAQRGRAINLGFRWTSASGELYPGFRIMSIFVVPYGGATILIESNTYLDFTAYGITATDLVGVTAPYSNQLIRNTSAAGWTCGFSTKTSNQRITGVGGGVSFAGPPHLTLGDYRLTVGLDQSNPDATQNSIDHALYFDVSSSEGNCIWKVLENGATVATGTANSWKYDDMFGGYLGRVQAQTVTGNPRIRYYVGNTLVHTSAGAPTFPLYVDASIYDPSTAVYGVCLYGSSVAGTFGSTTDWMRSTLEFPGRASVVAGSDRARCGGFAYRDFEVVPLVMSNEEVERRMRT
jgi:hypothetical protein